jgi:hypothetical protein
MSVELEANIYLVNFDSATYKDVWFINYRPQIQILMSGPSDNHLAALLLIIVCMDRVYTLQFPEKRNKRGYTQDMMKFFFPKPEEQDEEEYDRRMKTLTNDFVNALKHDTFVRANVVLNDSEMMAVKYDDNGKLTIAPTEFWGYIRDFIDSFYSQTSTRYK